MITQSTGYKEVNYVGHITGKIFPIEILNYATYYKGLITTGNTALESINRMLNNIYA